MLGFATGERGWLGIAMGGRMGGPLVKFGEPIGTWPWNPGPPCPIDWRRI